MKSLFTELRRWVRDVFRRPLTAEAAEDLPDTILDGKVYLIGDEDMPWSAAMRCPCGCSEVIRLSLIPDDKPRWKATVLGDSTVTLAPSVWRTKGCKSHFILRQGKVIWAKEEVRRRQR